MRLLSLLLFCYPFMVLSEAVLESVAMAVDKQSQQHVETVSENDKQLTKIDQLVELGAQGLALHFIYENQQSLSEDNLHDWLLWERKRIALLVDMENWQQIIDRIAEQKDIWVDLPFSIEERNKFITQQIEASLQLNQPEQALLLLRDQIWSAQASAAEIEEWRRLIIRSYLAMRRIDDAQRAMRRYRQDYGMDTLVGDQWILLQAQILIDSDHASQAIKLLDYNESIQGKALLLLARLQANVLSSEQAQEQARKLLDESKDNQNAQRLYWYVILRAAVLQQNYLIQVEALEALFELKSERYLSNVISQVENYVSADHLWSAYQQAGLRLANEFKLLRGDDEAWYLQASNLFEQQPLQARSLFAALAINAINDHHRQLSFENLASLLEKKKQGLEIIHQLFMSSKQISRLQEIPPAIRYLLVDYSLSHADLKTAARLMADLTQPPEGKDNFDWNLRRSRVLILGGEYQAGAEILQVMLNGREQLSEIQIDQYMQVVFDLQNVQSHQSALHAFEKLEGYPLSKKVQRELYFWKAESYQALDNHQQAAWLFLKSAQPIKDEIDPWYHTAVFKAAEAMAKAGLIKDAREQFIKLLRITGNDARKAVIRQRLQQLRLQQSHQLSRVAAE